MNLNSIVMSILFLTSSLSGCISEDSIDRNFIEDESELYEVRDALRAAEAALEEVVRLEPDQPDARLLLGLLADLAGDPAAAQVAAA